MINTEVLSSMDWLHLASKATAAAQRRVASCLVVVTETRGSSPQGRGAWLLVTADESKGSVGGGRLEEMAIDCARDLLRQQGQAYSRQWILGHALGQCCGGTMTLLFWPLQHKDSIWLEQAKQLLEKKQLPEKKQPAQCLFFPESGVVRIVGQRNAESKHSLSVDLLDSRPSLALFGAGHVGRRVAMLVACLPMRLQVFDQRQQELDKVTEQTNVCRQLVEDIVAPVASLESGCAAIVMTHMHSLDFLVVKELLKRTDVIWLGLIGSASKAQSFRSLLKKQGIGQQQIARLICPLGQTRSKDPGIIALETLTQINAFFSRRSEQQAEQLDTVDSPADTVFTIESSNTRRKNNGA